MWVNLSIIIADIITQSTDAYPLNVERLQRNEYINCVFIAMYGLEWLVKIASTGFNVYCRNSRSNVLDTAIVFLGSCDIVIASIFVWGRESMLVNSIIITVLRSVRLLRIFKLTMFWMRFELLLQTIAKTIIDIRAFSMLMGLFIFLYTIMGMEFF